MKAIFYKLVDPLNKHTWWKREVEITSFDQFREECLTIYWTRNTQRFCYLYNIKDTDDKIMIEQCKELIIQDRLADSYYIVERMYQMGAIKKELDQKYKMSLLNKLLHKIGFLFLKTKNFFVEFVKEGIDFYKELAIGIYFGLFRCK